MRVGPGSRGAFAAAACVQGAVVDPDLVDVAFERLDLPYKIGNTMEEAVEFNLALGPAAEAVRLAGDDGDAMRPRLANLLREALAEFETSDGLIANSSVWIVTARAAG